MAVTLKQIADRAGVPVQTVSRVLNPKEHLCSVETNWRIREIARELGYRPNTTAGGIPAGQFSCVALLMSTDKERSHLPGGLLYGIQEALAERDLHLSIANVPDEPLRGEGQMPKILRQLMADGLLVNYNIGIPEGMRERISEYGIASVWINSRHPADCVYLDDFGAGREATEHLLRLGHRRIAYVEYECVTPASHYSVFDRRDGYARAMGDAGLDVQVLSKPAELKPSEQAAFVAKWLSRPDRPTAVVAYAAWAAQPVVTAALSLGLHVPQDLSVITFNPRLLCEVGISMTTMLLPERQMGRAAVAMLLRKVAEPQRPEPPEVLRLEMADGMTTCSPRHA